ncbi:MAG: AGE family epimerase/isomerase [Cyanobacteria bacterium P01_F01_bin.86]
MIQTTLKKRVGMRSLQTIATGFALSLTLLPRLASGTEITSELADTVINTQVQTVDLYNGGPNNNVPNGEPTEQRGGFGAYSAAETVDPGWNGFTHAFINRDFSRLEVDFPARGMNHLIGQSRAIYINAETHRLLGIEDSRFLQVTQQAADFLIATAWDETHGGWYWGIEPSGTNPPLDNSDVYGPPARAKDAYGQVHASLSLATAYRVTQDPLHLEAAVRGWTHFKRNHADTVDGGYAPSFNRDYSELLPIDEGGMRNMDYMLHSFEAVIALADVTESELHAQLMQDAQEIGQHIVTRMVQIDENSWDGKQYTRAYIPWFFTADWQPAITQPDSPLRNYASPGHQFEFALFLSRAVEQGIGDVSWLTAAEQLLSHGLYYTYDHVHGTVNYDRFFLSGDPYASDEVVTWWPQAEAARALAHFAIVRDRPDLWDEFELTFSTIQTNLTDPLYGGWFSALSPDTLAPVDPEGVKGQPWKVYYHATMLQAELVRLSQLSE